jgi:F-type H+-transporting ATPase subunit b
MKKILPFVLMSLFFTAIVYASGGEGGHGGVNWKDLMWRFINFAALVALLWYLLADKIKMYFSERKKDIIELIDEVEKNKNEAEQQFSSYQKKFQDIEKDIQDIRKSLIGEIDKEKNRIIEEGKINAKRILEQAKASAEQESLNAKQELRNSVIELAGDMAIQIISKSMNTADQSRLIDEYLTKVER